MDDKYKVAFVKEHLSLVGRKLATSRPVGFEFVPRRRRAQRRITKHK